MTNSGVVAEFDEAVGLGVVTSGDASYPFHCTAIADGSRTIPVGAAVEFCVAPGRLGVWEAAAITPESS